MGRRTITFCCLLAPCSFRIGTLPAVNVRDQKQEQNLQPTGKVPATFFVNSAVLQALEEFDQDVQFPPWDAATEAFLQRARETLGCDVFWSINSSTHSYYSDNFRPFEVGLTSLTATAS